MNGIWNEKETGNTKGIKQTQNIQITLLYTREKENVNVHYYYY